MNFEWIFWCNKLPKKRKVKGDLNNAKCYEIDIFMISRCRRQHADILLTTDCKLNCKSHMITICQMLITYNIGHKFMQFFYRLGTLSAD